MIRKMNRRIIQRFNGARSKISLAKFDELNVLRTAEDLYKDLDRDFRDIMLALIAVVYRETEPHGDDEPGRKWLLALLSEPDPVTGYAYINEVNRKREYLAENLAASSNREAALRKAMSYWARMAAQYADIVTGEVMLRAFSDAGVNRVRWYTRDDERVCKACDKRHGKIYSINRIPARPHWGCRCWWEPVT